MNKAYLTSFLLGLLWIFTGTFAFAQGGSIRGKVFDEQNQPLPGASVQIRELKRTAGTDPNGNYSLDDVANGTYTLVATYIGYQSTETTVTVSGSAVSQNFTLNPDAQGLDEVVIVGYGSVRKSDLTGAVASVGEKEFNKGPLIAADQLIQGKVAGVQMINDSGQPGGATTVRIRGNSAVTGSGQPLYVVDGVALDGRSSRPEQSGGLGTSPGGNPLSFINPNDIASMEILKDASATAIYGSRAAYGVVLITTKRGLPGEMKVDFNLSGGVANLMRTVDILDGDQYRAALNQYGLTSGDFGDNVDAMDAITRTGVVQNHNISLSGGGENNKFRTSVGYQKVEGIIRKTDFERLSASFNGNFNFLESKKLGMDVNLIANQSNENIAPVTTDAGFQGSIVGQALNWNPTQPLRNPDGSPNVIPRSAIINPYAMSEAYNDHAKVSSILASLSPYYRFNDWLEYRFLGSVNYSTGIRRASTRSWINLPDIEGVPDQGIPGGYAGYANNELITTQLTHTLNFNKEIADKLNLNAIIGYEYMNFGNKGMSFNGRNYGEIDVDYTDALQAGPPSNRVINSFNDPTTELQSYFARAIFNYDGKYIVTGTFRRDGSTKFGANNKYGNFPSFSAAWNIKEESFLEDTQWLNLFKIRGGWGRTGNQEFPSGASVDRYDLSYAGGETIYSPVNNGNANLRWQSDMQTNIGFDFGLFNGRLSGAVDFFHKKTTDLLYPSIPLDPVSPGAGAFWINLGGDIVNKGVEFNVNATLIDKEDFNFNIGANLALLDNMVSGMPAPILTGSLSGQGMSGVTLEVIESGLPLFAMVTREYLGLDPEGFSQFRDDGFTFYYVGNPNPRSILGFTTDITYKRFSFNANFNGMIGREVYNNTANSVLPITNLGTRNIASNLIGGPVQEALGNAITASSRFVENGSYLKLANATLGYRIGDAGGFKNINVFLNGLNLFVITKYTGFDPEVNTDKSVNGIPSSGIEYTPYPSARTVNFGVNFSL